ncbi:GNAT family N-acetyltransferase [Psychrobacillus sp. FJAT-51614]|uniref:GNAT family N-acetyltransferase n=1 Tax=Psychrobacillus mangrovi TaxID=3117745 RepID=A0ABU8F263_9BACI
MESVITIDTLKEHEKDIVRQLLVESYSQFKSSYMNVQDWLDYAKDLKESVDNPAVDKILVARDGETLLGTLQLFTNSNAAYGRPELEIHSPIIRMLAVSPNARGKGIAQALLKESIHYAREKNSKHVYLHTSDKMTSAIRLYEWLGFKRDTSKEFKKLNFIVKCYRYDLLGDN